MKRTHFPVVQRQHVPNKCLRWTWGSKVDWRVLAAAVTFVLSGCAQVPPAQLAQARFDYGQEIAESWKRQTLMNVVRLRYNDTPAFLDVSGVVTSDSLSTKINGTSTLASTRADSKLDVGIGGTWTSSPTVTFSPIGGERFSKRFLEPMSPTSVLMLVQAGWPIDVVWPTMVSSVNSLQGQALGVPAEKDFIALQASLASLQRERALGFRAKSREVNDGLWMIFHRLDMPQVNEEAHRIRALLGVHPQAQQISVAYGELPRNDREVALNTRSMLEVLQELGAGVEVPIEHALKARSMGAKAAQTGTESQGGRYQPLGTIRSGRIPPVDAYSVVQYKGHWFWIDDHDDRTKRLFTLLMILFSLSDASQPLGLPVLSISPAN